MKTRKMLAMLLAVLTLMSTLSVTAFAKYSITTSNEGVDLEYPDGDEILSTVKVAKVKKTNNKAIWLMPKPEKGNGHLKKTVGSGKTVYIIAEHGEYYFFVTKSGYMGWNGKSYFKDSGTTDLETVAEIMNTPEMYERYYDKPDFVYLLDCLYAKANQW